MIHIHQGGTHNAYCGEPLGIGNAVGWEAAGFATCPGCRNAWDGMHDGTTARSAVTGEPCC